MIVSLDISNANELALFKSEFSDAYDLNALESGFNNGHFFALGKIEKGKIIGFITYSTSIDFADIETVFVLKEFRRKGIAESLINKMLEDVKSKGINRVLLEVRSSNIPAISLYKKLGFNEISIRKKYYSNLEDALILAKELTV
ncbi:MAG: ribosomal protein S18-alanine N-acetyltransferase [Clostridia bacterium]|nr:ribosomal protein S18-alanine N-acetyltransferase [Clostridia bacterium]